MYAFFQIFFLNFVSSCARYMHDELICTGSLITMNSFFFNCLLSECLHYQRSSRTLCVQVREVLSIDFVGKF
jgi:hypothetical protein